eukprot:COSAG02_NODE_68487_length_242_cov_2.357771_1_plen_49_part_10
MSRMLRVARRLAMSASNNQHTTHNREGQAAHSTQHTAHGPDSLSLSDTY